MLFHYKSSLDWQPGFNKLPAPIRRFAEYGDVYVEFFVRRQAHTLLSYLRA